MSQADPAHYIWWLTSRAAGIVALALVSLSVLLGLPMAARVIRRAAAASARCCACTSTSRCSGWRRSPRTACCCSATLAASRA